VRAVSSWQRAAADGSLDVHAVSAGPVCCVEWHDCMPAMRRWYIQRRSGHSGVQSVSAGLSDTERSAVVMHALLAWFIRQRHWSHCMSLMLAGHGCVIQRRIAVHSVCARLLSIRARAVIMLTVWLRHLAAEQWFDQVPRLSAWQRAGAHRAGAVHAVRTGHSDAGEQPEPVRRVCRRHHHQHVGPADVQPLSAWHIPVGVGPVCVLAVFAGVVQRRACWCCCVLTVSRWQLHCRQWYHHVHSVLTWIGAAFAGWKHVQSMRRRYCYSHFQWPGMQ
jgi:hypothetical protein